MSGPEQPARKIRLTFNRAKDLYCYACDDGGKILECGACHRGYCHNVAGDPEADSPVSLACLTVPSETIHNKHWVFRCPECLSEDGTTKIDYIINRGARATRRLSSKSSLVLVIFYLSSLKHFAEAMIAQLTAVLAVFEVHVVLEALQLPDPLDPTRVKHIHAQMLPEAPYHLAVLLLTESDPAGGWWTSSDRDKGGRGRTLESEFVEYFFDDLTLLSQDAVTSRIFIISCAVNLFYKDTLGKLFESLNPKPWHSIVAASAPSLLPWEFIVILPEVFVHLYYFGSPFRVSLLQPWAKSAEARIHTGLIIMQRSSWWNEQLEVSRWEHAPLNVRPAGFDLPMVPSLCGCWENQGRWHSHYWSIEYSELFSFYKSTCCSLELHIAIYLGNRRILHAHGTTIVEETWDEATRQFLSDPHYMVSMKLSPRRSQDLHAERPTHTEPWTKAGRHAAGLGSKPLHPL